MGGLTERALVPVLFQEFEDLTAIFECGAFADGGGTDRTAGIGEQENARYPEADTGVGSKPVMMESTRAIPMQMMSYFVFMFL